jgi:hypothetical protein
MMETEGSLLFAKEPTIGPHTEPDKSTPQLPTQFT